MKSSLTNLSMMNSTEIATACVNLFKLNYFRYIPLIFCNWSISEILGLLYLLMLKFQTQHYKSALAEHLYLIHKQTISEVSMFPPCYICRKGEWFITHWWPSSHLNSPKYVKAGYIHNQAFNYMIFFWGIDPYPLFMHSLAIKVVNCCSRGHLSLNLIQISPFTK